MTFNDYQKQALTTDSFKDASDRKITDPAYVAKILGLVGESGEVAEKYKKLIRNNKISLTAEQTKEMAKELGDVLWYIAILAEYLGVPLETVAQSNLDKLADRQRRDVIKSAGDNR